MEEGKQNMLTKKQFEILTLIERKGSLSQRALSGITGMSLGTVNRIVSQLSDGGMCDQKGITEKGLCELEPYKVQRAVILAAGFGSRLVPVTLNTPKPLVRVNGKRIIDTLLDALYAADIKEIYIVRGYLAEQFDQLLYKYPNVKFIDNPYFNEANNISSLMRAKDCLNNAYICEADLLIKNPDIITKYQYSTNYLGVPVEVTDDWCLLTQKNGYVTGISVGGRDCHHLFGISYWSHDDGERLGEQVVKVYNAPGGKERYWDQVALEYFPKDYKVTVRECTFDDITEIDTYKELCKIDKSYVVKV